MIKKETGYSFVQSPNPALTPSLNPKIPSLSFSKSPNPKSLLVSSISQFNFPYFPTSDLRFGSPPSLLPSLSALFSLSLLIEFCLLLTEMTSPF